MKAVRVILFFSSRQLGMLQSRHLCIRRKGSPVHSKLPSKGWHLVIAGHSISHHQRDFSEHIYPSVVNIVTIFKSSTSEGNEDRQIGP